MNDQIGKTISEARRKLGLTQKQLGEKLFVSGKTVSRWETGINYPDVTLLKDIARELDITVDELLGVSESRQESHHSAYNWKMVLLAFSLLLVVSVAVSMNRKTVIKLDPRSINYQASEVSYAYNSGLQENDRKWIRSTGSDEYQIRLLVEKLNEVSRYEEIEAPDYRGDYRRYLLVIGPEKMTVTVAKPYLVINDRYYLLAEDDSLFTAFGSNEPIRFTRVVRTVEGKSVQLSWSEVEMINQCISQKADLNYDLSALDGMSLLQGVTENGEEYLIFADADHIAVRGRLYIRKY